MNSQESQQAYRHLIEQILECSSTDEALELLYGRDELVNPSLVQALEQVSEELIQQDNWDSAYLLKTIAVNLEVVLKNPLSEGKSAESLRFFQNLLQATASTEGNRQVVYPILKANLNKLDDRFIAFLKDWGEIVVPTIYSFQSRSILPTFWYLGDLIQDFSWTDRAINLEIAIVCYEIALKFAPPATPNWMGLLHRLGNVYRNRIKDDPSENREKAIQYYENVLEVYNHNQIPLDERWVSILRNLGRAYSNERIDRVSSEDQEKTIQCYENALEFYNQTKIPQDIEWAHIQNDLAIAYRHRLKDDRALNLEKALECYREALEIYPESSREWGNTQNNLAISYCQRLYGNRIENLKLAIKHYKKALDVRPREAFADKWAETQINFGNANRNLADVDAPPPNKLSTSEREVYLKQAIECYKNALSELKPERSLVSWFHAKLNLANAYTPQKILGITGKNLKLAIECCEEILQVADGRLPQNNLAMVQNNLAAAYLKLEEQSENLNRENLNRAVNYCLLALKVRTDEAFPQEYAETQGNLGLIYKLQEKFPEAYDAFEFAINTVERLRGEIVSGDSIKQKLAEKFYGLYESMVEVCLNRALEEKKYYATAIEYVERSKARNLVEHIAQSELLPNVSESLLKRYKELQQEFAQEKRILSIENDEKSSNIANFSRLNRLRQELDDLVIKEIQPVDEKFALTQRVKPITYKEIKKLLGDNHIAIIEWYMMSKTFLAFIIIPNCDHPIVWQSEPKDLDDFMDWLMKYWQDYSESQRKRNDKKFQENLSSHLQELANILHIDKILSYLPSNCDRLILIPHRFLHLFPLQALPQNNGIRLIDRFKRGVSFTPSCQLLQLTQTLQRSAFNKLFAIQNPACSGDKLVFSDVEVGCIKDIFSSSSQILSGDQAKKEAIDSKKLGSFHCVHFSCHGYFNWEFPMKSALILANAKTDQYFGGTDLKKCLTLSEIFGLSLGECRLVTLSACETGLVDIRSFVDEYIGLPNGFLVAGSPSVVSSLWTVNDASTCFLMIKLYEELIKLDNLKPGDVVITLNQTQKWLRNLTIKELEIFLEEHKTQIEQTFAQLRGNPKGLFEENLKQIRKRQPLPFISPYYWAAFIATGV